MRVETILNTKGGKVHTLGEHQTLADAVALLNSNNIGAVVITTQNGEIAGILSERDIVRRLGTHAHQALALPIREVMTKGVFTCTRDSDIDEVMESMTAHRIRHMPVAENLRLIGIISIGDVVKHKIEQAEHEAAALKEYIAS
jgi:CBS domain-containing protein